MKNKFCVVLGLLFLAGSLSDLKAETIEYPEFRTLISMEGRPLGQGEWTGFSPYWSSRVQWDRTTDEVRVGHLHLAIVNYYESPDLEISYGQVAVTVGECVFPGSNSGQKKSRDSLRKKGKCDAAINAFVLDPVTETPIYQDTRDSVEVSVELTPENAVVEMSVRTPKEQGLQSAILYTATIAGNAE